ncbi:CGNR zinc finger domain-containing protein [Stygiobacter electus]|uniref:CGNR zinc finger domain-containing protein n=1 Tax=Stygiobacter electus TaxID=3032292 RepID=A0AAE3NYG8_9BACT|nr:CGNR zinc finger domain-containing protein [Stygiobacter electus]MDF1613286.1 CGNR zinc finger domain-containing protein [Stygiobacter electus]
MNKWKFVGGNIAIDFVNSIGGRNEKGIDNYTIRDEKLNSYEDIVNWAEEIGIVSTVFSKKLIAAASENSKEANKVFERAKLLREALYRIFRHTIEEKKPLTEDIEILNKECSIARGHQELNFSLNKFFWDFKFGDQYLDIILWNVALSAAELLTSERLFRLKRCAGEDCGWLFLDMSKNQSRQWCDMKDCGNFEKVRRFREKQRI